MYKAVIFDFGGVIMRSPLERFREFELDEGIEPGSIARLNMQNMHENAWAKFERGELDEAGFIAAFRDEAAAAGIAVDPTKLLSLMGGDLVEEMVSLIRTLRGNYLLAILTNNFTHQSNSGAMGPVRDLFDYVFESSRLGMRKPEPSIYRHVCAQMGIDPSESIFLDDLGINLKPARALGMTTIKVVDPSAATLDLKRLLGIATEQ